eukprot:TRINITY_DN33467_c0_g1_i1.p1 TRINITY_DN33467_c0_g1~~TRINITY_DN33467_c0_g1_i1.p1  ORF type:complete len:527 (+),score=107.94 TRINITY_DN33467_c0_g1_i1:86-1666(+)
MTAGSSRSDSQEEYRQDRRDGRWYTQADFIAEYGGTAEWDDAPRAPAASSPDAGAGAAAAPPPQHSRPAPGREGSLRRTGLAGGAGSFRSAPAVPFLNAHTVQICDQCGEIAHTAKSTLHEDAGAYCRTCWMNYVGVAHPVGGLPPKGATCDQCGATAPVRASTDPDDHGRYCKACWQGFLGDAEPLGGVPSSRASSSTVDRPVFAKHPSLGADDVGDWLGTGDGTEEEEDEEGTGYGYAYGGTGMSSTRTGGGTYSTAPDLGPREVLVRLMHLGEPLGVRTLVGDDGPLQVCEVRRDGAFHRAGIRPPAEILAVEGNPISGALGLQEAVERLEAEGRSEFVVTVAPGADESARALEDASRRLQEQFAEMIGGEAAAVLGSSEYVQWLGRRSQEKALAMRRPLPMSPPPPLRSRQGALSGIYAAHAGDDHGPALDSQNNFRGPVLEFAREVHGNAQPLPLRNELVGQGHWVSPGRAADAAPRQRLRGLPPDPRPPHPLSFSVPLGRDVQFPPRPQPSQRIGPPAHC